MSSTGGNAFPTTEFIDGVGERFDSGMTLRDYFAAKAMQGIVSNWDYEKEGNCIFNPKVASSRAYAMADSMLEARKA